MAGNVRFTSAARKASTLSKLGVSPEQIASAPQITQPLKGVKGGLKAALRAMRFSQDPVVQSFLAKRDSLGVWERENASWEAIGLAAGVDLMHLLGAALLALRKLNLLTGDMIAMSHHPNVVKKRIEFAKLPGGWRDRAVLHKLFLSIAGSDASNF
jgi:hypothetical protein